jgi:proteasome lid subunit RPN8/RPN11
VTTASRSASPDPPRLLSVFGAYREPPSSDVLLILDAVIITAILAHLRECLPLEGAGLLSVLDRPPAIVADRYYPARNADASPARFTMDPLDVLLSAQDMERRGRRVGAIVHSHPRTPPVPSRGDIAEATVPGALMVVVGFQPTVSIRGWCLQLDCRGNATGAVEIPVVMPGNVLGPPRISEAGLSEVDQRRQVR